jgi:hypothetical protein
MFAAGHFLKKIVYNHNVMPVRQLADYRASILFIFTGFPLKICGNDIQKWPV